MLFQASYGVEDPEYAITQLAQTTMRSEIGKIALDTVFRERESLNIAIVRESEKQFFSFCLTILYFLSSDINLMASYVNVANVLSL